MAFNRSQAIHHIIGVEFAAKGTGVGGVWNDVGDAPPPAYIDWWLPRRRAELQAMSNDELQAELAACGWRERIREAVIVERMEASIEGQQRNQAVEAAHKSASKRTEQATARNLEIVERGRRLLANDPKVRTAKQVHNRLGLTMPLSTFQRRLWSEIRRQQPG